jgi:protein SCO1/2
MIGDWMNSWANAKNQAPRPSYDKVGAFTLEEHDGRYLFAKHCAACHTIGHGDKIGPDLKDISSARDQAWLYKLIQTPDKMITEKDPLALQLFEKYKQVNMPNLRLSDEETKAILKFLKDPTAAPVPHEPAHDAGDKSGAAKVEPAAAHP